MATRRINPGLLQKVKALTLADKRQDEIADALNIHRNSVYRHQKRLGLHAWQGITEEQEKVTLDLLKAGRGVSSIGKDLGCGEYQVSLVKKKYGIRRRIGQVGYRWKPTTRQVVDIMDLALSHQISAAAIARKVGGPYKPVLRLCHKACGCERFITGRALDSYLPMRWAANKIGTAKQARHGLETTILLVDHVNQKYFDGQLAEDQLVYVLVEAAIATFRRERTEVFLGAIELEKIRTSLGAHFREAVDALRLGNGLVN
jgi:hypothetical protein